MTVTQSHIIEIAERLRKAAETGVAIAPIREALAPGGVEAAYQVQAENTRYFQQQGRKVVGCKIGLTSLAVQKQLGVDSPDFGSLFDDMKIIDGETVALRRVMQPKVEAEIAVVLNKDLTGENFDAQSVRPALDHALPAIEIVGSRIANWDIRLLDTIADNASSGLFVLGTKPVGIDDVDWLGAKMTMTKAGEVVSRGVAADCLGDPLNAVAWLATTMSKLGSPLKAGDVIMTGALGPMAVVSAGDSFVADIEGLGSVRAVFSA